MARTTLTYGGMNLNDGTTWRLLPGFDPGADELSYDEHRAYKGTVAQYNVSRRICRDVRAVLSWARASWTSTRPSETLNAEIAAARRRWSVARRSCVSQPRASLPSIELALTAFCSFVDFRPVATRL